MREKEEREGERERENIINEWTLSVQFLTQYFRVIFVSSFIDWVKIQLAEKSSHGEREEERRGEERDRHRIEYAREKL